MLGQIKKIWIHLSDLRKNQFRLLLILMIAASFFEVITVGAVLPFLGVLTSPDQVYGHPLAQPFIQILELTSPSQLVLPVTILFMVAVLLAGLVRLLLLYAMTRISYATGADLSINIYRRTLFQKYTVHVSRNSSELINGIISKTNTVIGGVILPTLNLISAVILFIGIMSVLFTIDTLVALSASIGFGVLYLLVARYTKIQLKKNSQIIADQSTQMVKSLQEGLGGIRDVLVNGSQEFYCQLYRNADLPLRHASGTNQFIIGSPRYVMESIGMILIAGLAYLIIQQGKDTAIAIPMLGALALGAQRLLPVLQQAYVAYSTIKGSKSSFEDVLNLMNQPLPEYFDKMLSATPILFEKEIKLENISFRYTKDAPWVLKNINLSIDKGACIGFIGVTGSGKSTLIDIIMGLLTPVGGNLTVDQQLLSDQNIRLWQMNIAHVPQNIYLSDGTIGENIAFGIPKNKVNYKQVVRAAKQAKISELIDQWKDGYQTLVGERGVRLSGGQRQRIGIARALYKQADVLIFDEATSSLDSQTESEIMKVVNNLDKNLTILIIAHRMTTLKKCDKIIDLSEFGKIVTKKYNEIAEQK